MIDYEIQQLIFVDSYFFGKILHLINDLYKSSLNYKKSAFLLFFIIC